MNRNKISGILNRCSLLILLMFISIFVIVPIYWTLITSFKVEGNIMKEPRYIPNPLTFENYRFAWVKSSFSLFFWNTIIVSTITAVFVIVLAILAAYGLSRFRFAGQKAFISIFLITQLIPGAILIIPFFMIFNSLRLINTLTSLVITYVTTIMPFSAILMKSFVDGIPVQLEEAGMIDGCTRVGVIFRILLPILMPGAVAVGAFAFLNSWNEFLYPLMFLNAEKNFVIAIGLSYMLGQNNTYYGGLAAGSIIALSVPLIIFIFMQKYLVIGLSSGAVKG